MFTVEALIHSRNGTDKPTDTVTIVEENGCNHVIAEYNGQGCTAIFKPYVSMYYVDDVYGKIKTERR